MKIAELKETSANRDVSQGSSDGATAAAAIAALQEAGNKTSRDMIAGSYRAYVKLDYLIIELVRQFYDQERSFRILGPESCRFVSYSNAALRGCQTGTDSAGNPLVRRPVFDVKIRAQKRNPFAQASQNELARGLYAAGFFDPQRADEALGALEIMEFEGKERVAEWIRQNRETARGDGESTPEAARSVPAGGTLNAHMAKAQAPVEDLAQKLARGAAQ